MLFLAYLTICKPHYAKFILILHNGHLSFCFSQKLMHFEWNFGFNLMSLGVSRQINMSAM